MCSLDHKTSSWKVFIYDMYTAALKANHVSQINTSNIYRYCDNMYSFFSHPNQQNY